MALSAAAPSSPNSARSEGKRPRPAKPPCLTRNDLAGCGPTPAAAGPTSTVRPGLAEPGQAGWGAGRPGDQEAPWKAAPGMVAAWAAVDGNGGGPGAHVAGAAGRRGGPRRMRCLLRPAEPRARRPVRERREFLPGPADRHRIGSGPGPVEAAGTKY